MRPPLSKNILGLGLLCAQRPLDLQVLITCPLLTCDFCLRSLPVSRLFAVVIVGSSQINFPKTPAHLSAHFLVESSAYYATFCSRLSGLLGKGHGQLLPCCDAVLRAIHPPSLQSFPLSLAHTRSCTHWASNLLLVGPRASPPSVLPALLLQSPSPSCPEASLSLWLCVSLLEPQLSACSPG